MNFWKWLDVAALVGAAVSASMAAVLGEGQQLLMFLIGAGALNAGLSLAGIYDK